MSLNSRPESNKEEEDDGVSVIIDATTLYSALLVQNNHFIEMCCGAEAGSYVRPIDSCITQIKAQGTSRTCNESKEEEEEEALVKGGEGVRPGQSRAVVAVEFNSV